VENVLITRTTNARRWKVRRRVQRIVIFGRYTPLVGTPALYSGPFDVRAFSGGVFVGWQGTGLGLTPASVEYTMELSQDLEHWIETDVLTPSAGAEETVESALDYPWMRWKAEITGADPCVTGWLVGDLVYREGMGPGGGA
jgi:hypothetical protein